jgi:hypothetical protein
LNLCTKGTPEQVAAFPWRLFLFNFIQAWNKGHGETDFVNWQLDLLEEFDKAESAPQVLILILTTMFPTPPPSPPPQPRPITQVTEVPLPALLASMLPDPLPSCALGPMPSNSSVLTQHRVMACPNVKRKVIDADDDDQPLVLPQLD